MTFTRFFARTAVLFCANALATQPAIAQAAAYRFELAGQPQPSGGGYIIQIRLLHAPDSKPVPDAIIFESSADMGPMGMATMTAPVKPVPAEGGVYSFDVQPSMAGTWAIHLAAKVQGESETVRGTINADLVQ